MMQENRSNIPADLRRQVLIESGHRCAITTCRNSASIDIHHIIPWSECLQHSFDNLIVLCPNCHRLVHSGKIDRKSLFEYKKNLKNNDFTNMGNNLVLDRKTFDRLKKTISIDLFQKLKNNAFGDHKTMEILQPFDNFLNLCEDPTFVFKNQEFEKEKKNLYIKVKDMITYIHPFLQQDNNGDTRIGPTDGSIMLDFDASEKWYRILDECEKRVWDVFNLYKSFVETLTKELT